MNSQENETGSEMLTLKGMVEALLSASFPHIEYEKIYSDRRIVCKLDDRHYASITLSPIRCEIIMFKGSIDETPTLYLPQEVCPLSTYFINTSELHKIMDIIKEYMQDNAKLYNLPPTGN